MQAQAAEYRQALIEAVAEQDEGLLEKFFEGEEISDDEIKNRHPEIDHRV